MKGTDSTRKFCRVVIMPTIFQQTANKPKKRLKSDFTKNNKLKFSLNLFHEFPLHQKKQVKHEIVRLDEIYMIFSNNETFPYIQSCKFYFTFLFH